MATSSLRKILLLLALLAFLAGGWFFFRQAMPPANVGKLTLALPSQMNSASVIVAHAQGLFKKNGIEVINQPFLLGKDALKSMIEGNADLAVVSDTSFMLAYQGGQDLSVVANLSESRRSLAVVVQADRGIERIPDLKNTSLALVKGTNLMYFVDSLLNVNGVASESVNQVNMGMQEGIAAFKEKKVDALVIFEPFLAQLQAEMGKSMKVFYGEDVYAFRFYLVGRPSYIDAHPQQVQAVLRALEAANKAIVAQPTLARQQVGKVVKASEEIMARVFDPQDFVLEFDQAMLLSLDDQTRWAMKHGLVPKGAVPNYLKAMKYKNLEAVDVGAVKFAH
jgi:NitT/TauT family transport system substrate-binding protein